jgi:ElaB/YqjD/DUF883 family membrane-anchored ribosome-binding protein
MEPTAEASRPNIETARDVGRQRIDKFLNWVAPVMAPDVLMEMGKNAAQDKVAEAKDKLENLAEHVKDRAAEIKDRFIEKARDARDRVVDRYEDIKDKTIYKAKELGKRAAVLGLTPVAKLEETWENVYQIPAEVRTWAAGRQEGRVTAAELASEKAKEKHEALLKLIEEQHKQELAEISRTRESAAAKASEHREKAAQNREKAASFRGVRSLVEGLKPSA